MIYSSIMRSATVADLRNQFRRVSAWIEEGQTVEIMRRGKPFARLSGISEGNRTKSKPDMLAQLREIWGEKMYSETQVQAMKEAELDGEEG
jgi:antitoxin (DNA-binding transcriptional repressor) of toxin-antitoxin stability system